MSRTLFKLVGTIPLIAAAGVSAQESTEPADSVAGHEEMQEIVVTARYRLPVVVDSPRSS